MLQMGAEKMAKSVGNVALLGDVIERWGRDALVLFFCTGHYRQPLAFDDEALDRAHTSAERIRELGRRLGAGETPAELAPLRDRFFGALRDDFNTPEALAAVFEWVREANRRLDAGEQVGGADLREMLGVIGLENLLDDAGAAAPDEVIVLAQARQAAREARDFAESDRLRDEIAARGWTVRDVAGGFELLES